MGNMILYKTGDACPCCGQPIKLTRKSDLWAFSVVCHVLGLNDVARTEDAVKRAEDRRMARREPGCRR